MWWVVGVVATTVLVATYITWIAGRVDRLHARAAAAQAALDAHLVRRAAAASLLATQVGADPLVKAAEAALSAPPEDREQAENDLTRALRATLPRSPMEPAPAAAGAVVTADVAAAQAVAASRRVALARQVHNDLVRDALAVRRRRLVRVLRLARRHPEPTYFDVDDPILDSGASGEGASGEGTAGEGGAGRDASGGGAAGEGAGGRDAPGEERAGADHRDRRDATGV
jgi:hypothetical protein